MEPRRRWSIWISSLLFWSVPAAVSAIHTWLWSRQLGHPLSFARSALSEVPAWYVLALISPPLLVFLERKAERRSNWRDWLWTAAVAVLATATVVTVFTAADLVRRADKSLAAFLRVLPHATLAFLPVVFLAFVVLDRQARALARAREAERAERARAELALELAAAQVRAVEGQLHPHFLFNTLDSVVALLREGQTPRAVRATVLLAELLRSLLAWRGTSLVRLDSELELVRKYVELEQLRFSDRLRVDWQVEPGVLDALVPPLVLQPLVENAVRHGVQQRARAGLLRIGGRALGAQLELWVEDDGPGPSVRALEGPGQGLGLGATRERVMRMFGEGGEVALTSRPEGGALARVRLPLTRSAAAS